MCDAKCTYVEKVDGRTNSPSSFKKSSDKGDAKRNVDDTCYGCGQTGHRKSDCPHRNEKGNHCGKHGHLSLMCQSGSDVKVNTHLVDVDNLNEKQCREIQGVWSMSVCNSSVTVIVLWKGAHIPLEGSTLRGVRSGRHPCQSKQRGHFRLSQAV